MLFPPPGVKIRRTLETFFLPGTPTLLAEHDPRRVLLVIIPDYNVSVIAAIAGNREGLNTPTTITGSYGSAYEFWGPEEVWVQCLAPSNPTGGNILVQSVFYD